MIIFYYFLEVMNSLTDISGLFSHWFWLNENTLLFNVSEISNIHHFCIAKIDEDFKQM